MSDYESDLISWLERRYTQEQERIKLIQLVRERQANPWWRLRQTLKGWFKRVG